MLCKDQARGAGGTGGKNIDLHSWSHGLLIFLLVSSLSFTNWVIICRALSKAFPWRRKWQPTPALLPGKSHGWRSLVSYSPWGLKESDTTEQLHSSKAWEPNSFNLWWSISLFKYRVIKLESLESDRPSNSFYRWECQTSTRKILNQKLLFHWTCRCTEIGGRC